MVRQALAAAAELERYFRLTDPAGETAEWQPVSTLYTTASYTTSSSPLDEILEGVRRAKGDCEPRVAASIFFLGYAARLLSPPLACIATTNCLPHMPAGGLLWRRPDDGMIEFGM